MFIEDQTFIYPKILRKMTKKKWCNTSCILMENATTTLLDAEDIHLITIISWIVLLVIQNITFWIPKNALSVMKSCLIAWTAHLIILAIHVKFVLLTRTILVMTINVTNVLIRSKIVLLVLDNLSQYVLNAQLTTGTIHQITLVIGATLLK